MIVALNHRFDFVADMYIAIYLFSKIAAIIFHSIAETGLFYSQHPSRSAGVSLAPSRSRRRQANCLSLVPILCRQATP
jgi:hypothetical protein